MNRRERALTALDLKEPDMVPLFDVMVDGNHIKAITGMPIIASPTMAPNLTQEEINKKNYETLVRCCDSIGFDLIPWQGTIDMLRCKGKIRIDGTIEDHWGAIFGYDATRHMLTYIHGSNKNVEEFFDRPFPDPYENGMVSVLEYTKRLVKEEMAICGYYNNAFSAAWYSFGMENFFRLMVEKPQSAKKVIDRITKYNEKLIKAMADAGADLIGSGGDYADKNNLLVPPKYFKEFIFPSLKKEVNAAHKKGLKYLKHSDGNLNLILDDLANIVDAIHSIEPSAGMNIETIKQKYGDRLVLMGNIDATYTLCRKGPAETIKEVRECIRVAAPGGGYFLSTSSEWFYDMKLSNLLAMVVALRRYGKYPIRL